MGENAKGAAAIELPERWEYLELRGRLRAVGDGRRERPDLASKRFRRRVRRRWTG